MGSSKLSSKKKNSTTSVVKMSRMDFEIARFAFERSTEIGLTPAEVSFLLGKKDAYFFDLLNPTDKNKFKTEQPDLLPAILDCKIRQIIPNDVQPDEQITITGTKTFTFSPFFKKTKAYYSQNVWP